MIILTFIIGTILGLLILKLYESIKLKNFHLLATEIINKAELESEKIIEMAKLEITKKEITFDRENEKILQKERKKIENDEFRLKNKEDKFEERLNLFEKKLSQIEKQESLINIEKDKLNIENEALTKDKEKFSTKLEEIAKITTQEAKDQLFDELSNGVKKDAENFIRKTLKEAEESAQVEANKIIITSINRLAKPCVSESTVKTVSLPSDDMKGRIVGKEGRNIRTLEKLTGVNFLIDDTPGAVVLSGFDPIRLHIAQIALTDLLSDGRIHPTRIAEVVEKASGKLDKQIIQWGKDAAFQTGNMDLHEELIKLLGKLKFRLSLGQNVLEHSIEVSLLMGLMASELKLNTHLAKRIGLLHDIGKAVSHEIEGSHAIVGQDLALKFGESKEVAGGIGSHHKEIALNTIEAGLLNAADTISAARPGARVEAINDYIVRLKKLEDISYQFPGIDKAYALQAGREVQVFVLPEMIDDNGLVNLARDITKKIEKELKYPGKIKVSVIREKKIVEYAV